jgi:hypothetical protein
VYDIEQRCIALGCGIPAPEARHAQELNPGGVELLVIPDAHRRQDLERMAAWFDQLKTD